MSCLVGLLERGVHTTIIPVMDVCDVDEHQLFCGRKGLSDAGTAHLFSDNAGVPR